MNYCVCGVELAEGEVHCDACAMWTGEVWADDSDDERFDDPYEDPEDPLYFDELG